MEFMRVCAKIDKNAIKHNIKQIRDITPEGVKLMPVIKADGYGHGALTMALETLPYADYFAVAIIEEALELRKNGISTPILLLGHTWQEYYEDAIKNDITLTVLRKEDAEEISKIAVSLGKKAKIHIAIDTGMSRIGFFPNEESADTIFNISKLDNIFLEGIFTHFSTADEADTAFTKEQLSRFMMFKKLLEERGVDISIYHTSNSAAIMQHGDCTFDMVRPGIILYGLYPSDEVEKATLDLTPVMELHSHISYIKTVKKGDSISYGRTFTAQHDMKIATIPVGYADGYPRLLSNKGRVIINGCYAPITGRICMDQFMVDVSHIENVKVGDKVILMGRDGELFISADEIAGYAQTINYEIVCGIGKRVPREVI